MIDRSKWDNFMTIEELVFHELFIEFLYTFFMEKSTLVDFDKKGFVQFQLEGNQFFHYLNEFTMHCGFYNEIFTLVRRLKILSLILGMQALQSTGERLHVLGLKKIMILGSVKAQILLALICITCTVL